MIFLIVAGHWYERTWWNPTIHWYMHYQCLFWDIWCPCSRWNCWRHFLDVPGVHSGRLLVYYCTLWYSWTLYISLHYTFHDMSFLCFQSFLAGLAASGVLTSALRLITKAAFEDSQNGLRNGASTSLSCPHILLSYTIKEITLQASASFDQHMQILKNCNSNIEVAQCFKSNMI
jgi:hypothetical protein